MVDKPLLAIVVPCYNEEEVLPETARRLTALLEQLPLPLEKEKTPAHL